MTIQNGVVKISSANVLQIDLIVKLTIEKKSLLLFYSVYRLVRHIVMKIKDRKD